MNTASTLTKEQMKDAKALCAELPIIQARLVRAGLHETAKAFSVAVKSIGFEVAAKAPA